MKSLFILLLFTTLIHETKAQACNRPVNPKKVVLMISFHDGSEEERGAREAACARGEKLVVLPKPDAETIRAQGQLSVIRTRLSAIWRQMDRCTTDQCRAQKSRQLEQMDSESMKLEAKIKKPDFDGQLADFLSSAHSQGTKISSLILSGHDGGGSFYGDYGRTSISEVSDLVKKNPEAFQDTNSLLLMGCWTGSPDQVEQWRTIFPKLRVLGGFVGSAPASTRSAAGTYVSGLLRGEKNLRPTATMSEVQSMIRAVENLNSITASVFVSPVCEEEGPAYYYLSPANNPEDLPQDMRPGLNTLQAANERELACRRAFGGDGKRGTFDWNALTQYFQGKREPENNPDLRGLYSFLRNNQHCFNEGYSTAPIDAEQVLFLRFFKDAKKNFNKFFEEDLEEMYRTIEEAVAASDDPQLKQKYQGHKKLVGESLVGMNRSETLQEISHLTGVYDRVLNQIRDPAKAGKVTRMMGVLDTNLYRLKCLPPQWHDFTPGEILAPPSC